MSTKPSRRKLIEVSLPLESINAAASREKSVRQGHPSTLHLYWARRPLAACRAVIFAQMVDDPSAWPDRFPSLESQDIERRRLHRVIETIVRWEASGNEEVLSRARWEIARTVAWERGEEPPSPVRDDAVRAYLLEHASPVYDPFSGGGSVPMEAQRLGLRAYGSDLNPVAVLIGKALIELPPKFCARAPVNPSVRYDPSFALHNWDRAQGLAADIRHYGEWVKVEAARRIGHLYNPAAKGEGRPDVVAWLWARLVRSPDPAAKGAKVPLVSSFILSNKTGKKAWVEVVLDAKAEDGWRFEVHSGTPSKKAEERLRVGTKIGRGNFACVLTGAPISEDWIRTEGKAGRIASRLMAIVVDTSPGRAYLDPGVEDPVSSAEAAWEPSGELYEKALGFRVPAYGYKTWASLFNRRQLATLTCFVELIAEVRERVLGDADAAGLVSDDCRLHEGGSEATAYADAVATYLALAVNRSVMGGNTLVRWNNVGEKAQHAFGRQALPMIWDYAETNLLGTATGSLTSGYEMVANGLLHASCSPGSISHADAASNEIKPCPAVISTDPPYYDNVGYADLSDFFYVWLRPALVSIWPDLFRRLATPKQEELVATPQRHGGKAAAEAFFMRGMGGALRSIAAAATTSAPVAIYYAFKQSEIASEGITSAGWSSFLQAVVDAGFIVDGTWPLRTEMATRMRGQGSNALASSIVLVCRKRTADAAVATRADFIRALKSEMPIAIDIIRKAGVGPVDMQQSVIGPGMAVFSRHLRVLEDDDSAMSVKTALALINRVWGEIENELDASFDSETQVALAWFADYGFDKKKSGELITLANAKNVPSNALFSKGVFKDLKGDAALTPRDELTEGWMPAAEKSLTVWECVQHTARVLNAAEGGGEAAAHLVAQMGPKGAEARALAYRLFEIATNKGWAAEALVYNELAQEWPRLEDLAQGIASGRPYSRASQSAFAFTGEA